MLLQCCAITSDPADDTGSPMSGPGSRQSDRREPAERLTQHIPVSLVLYPSAEGFACSGRQKPGHGQSRAEGLPENLVMGPRGVEQHVQRRFPDSML